jgi:hypothetical protein
MGWELAWPIGDAWQMGEAFDLKEGFGELERGDGRR